MKVKRYAIQRYDGTWIRCGFRMYETWKGPKKIIQRCRKTPNFRYGDIRHIHRIYLRTQKPRNDERINKADAKRYQVQNLPEQGTKEFNQPATWLLQTYLQQRTCHA